MGILYLEQVRPEIAIKCGTEKMQFSCRITKARIQILIAS
jgi:hypothetical protein